MTEHENVIRSLATLVAGDAVLIGEGESNGFDSLAFNLLKYFLHAAFAAQGARLRRAASASL